MTQLALFSNSLAKVEPENIALPKSQEIELRDYQIKAIKEIYRFYKSGKKSGMLYAPTGSGKTVMALKIIKDAVKRGKKVLFCCHRTKLITQTKHTLESQGLPCSVIWGDREELYDESAPVQIAMIQTLQSRELPSDIGLVIFDEVHSSIYWRISQEIMDYYSGGVWASSKCYFLGLTATPWRTKKTEGYCQFFQFIVRCPDPIDLINQNYLTRPRLFGYGGIIDFSKLESSNGDYSDKSLAAVLTTDFNQNVVNNSLDLIKGKKGILIGGNVNQCQELNQMFLSQGIKSKAVVGSTSEFERDLIFNQLRIGEIDLICSVNCLCEGYDEPSIDYVIIARPTRSKALLIQICGRALRLFPNKKEALLLDFGECFQKVCRPTSKLAIKLCPEGKKETSFNAVKECSNCHEYISNFAKICPHCGYEIPEHEIPENESKDNSFIPDFGELLDEETEKQLKYVRSQMKRAFKLKQNPWKIKSNFLKKFGFCAPDNWFLGAIFGEGIRRDSNKEIYANFLKNLNPSESFIKKMMALEFGDPNKTYKVGSSNYQTSSFNPKGKLWHEVFNLNPNSSWEMIKEAYKQLSKLYHPDISGDKESQEKMKIINNAYDLAKKARNR